MATFFFSTKCQTIDICDKNSKMLLSLNHEKMNLEIKIVKNLILKAPHSMGRRPLTTLLEIGGIIKFYKQNLK